MSFFSLMLCIFQIALIGGAVHESNWTLAACTSTGLIVMVANEIIFAIKVKK